MIRQPSASSPSQRQVGRTRTVDSGCQRARRRGGNHHLANGGESPAEVPGNGTASPSGAARPVPADPAGGRGGERGRRRGHWAPLRPTAWTGTRVTWRWDFQGTLAAAGTLGPRAGTRGHVAASASLPRPGCRPLSPKIRVISDHRQGRVQTPPQGEGGEGVLPEPGRNSRRDR